MVAHTRQRGKPANVLGRKWKSIWKKITSLRKEYPLLRLLNDPELSWITATLLILLEVSVNIFVIENIPYTEIDWKAYMQEVEGFANGTLDYQELQGDTGPLVYPAGFVYTFLLLYKVTHRGLNIYLAQYIFAALYLSTLLLVFRLYNKSKIVPPYAMIFMCCTSYRIHSIYVLRLFNDPVAIFFLFLAINCFVSRRWTTGCLLYSFAVSVKMNILLFAPALLVLLLTATGMQGTICNLIVCAVLQVIVGLPFLFANPLSYITRAFNMGRIFLYQWTVNWRFLPEEVFVSRYFHITLLLLHFIVILFCCYQWKRYLGLPSLTPSKGINTTLSVNPNFIGMIFCRSLHYQFYVWYFFTLPYLLWSTSFPPVIKLCLLGLLELSWNTYPSTIFSSILLHSCHLVLLCGLLFHSGKISEEKCIKSS